ncbi:MAG TPA: hypothetical protein VLI46_10985, partial [Ramlibacter sp.]|nr:hypothetical protein [Ramlibacter sp.]
MSESVVLKFAAIVGGIFGLALVFMPNGLAAMYGAPPMNATGVYSSMLYGGTFIGFAAMNWAASSANAAGQRRYVILGDLVANFAGLLIALSRQFTSDAATEAGWINVGLFLLFAALFAYLHFWPQGGTRV